MAELSLEEAPRKLRDMYEKGFAAMERGNLDYAIDTFSNILALEPRLLKVRRFLRAAQVKHFKDKKGGGATHILSSIAGIGGVLSVSSSLKKDPLKALKASEKLLQADPLNKTFINLHVQAAEAAELPEAAILMLEVAREFYPRDIEILQKLGKLYLDNNLASKGREIFEILLSLKPNDPKFIKAYKDASAIDTMSKGWTDAGSYRDVMKDTAEATRLEQEAKSVKSTKDLDVLIADSLAKIEKEPQNINYRRGLADLYVRDNRFDEALGTLQAAQELSGGADPQIDRAISAARLKQYDFKIAALQAAGDEENATEVENEKHIFELADAEERVKRYPNDLQFRYDLGVLYYQHDQLNEAIQQFQLAQRNPQRRNRALYFMGLCFKEKQQYDIALEQLQKAASELQIMDATKKDILYELGTIAEAMGDKLKAAQYYKEIYSVDISYKDIAQKIEKSYS
jgi:tetratricopeptide (TPR) repeat protein